MQTQYYQFNGSACGMLVTFSAVPGDFFWGLVWARAIGVRKSSKKIAVSTHCGARMRDEVVKTVAKLLPEAARAARKAVGNPADHGPCTP